MIREVHHSSLQNAITDIETVMMDLDTREEPCGHCGVVKKVAWEEHKAFKELEAIARKLNNLSERLERERLAQMANDMGPGPLIPSKEASQKHYSKGNPRSPRPTHEGRT